MAERTSARFYCRRIRDLKLGHSPYKSCPPSCRLAKDLGAWPELSNATMADTNRQLWTPFFLRRDVLCVFLISHLAIAAALAALFHYSNNLHGFTSADSKNHLLWQYGPTAGKHLKHYPSIHQLIWSL